MTKYSELKVGDKLLCDSGFTCMSGEVEVQEDEVGLYVSCSEGKHYLDGQLDFDDHDTLVGLTKVE